jgi:hypothetical protein
MMEKEFVKTYNKVTGELRGNLTEEEYRELISLEYMFMYNYKNKDDENRYQELKDKKYGKPTNKI